MKIVGFLRKGGVVLVRRRGDSLALNRKVVEDHICGAHTTLDLDTGDLIPDCSDRFVSNQLVELSESERKILKERSDACIRIEESERTFDPTPLTERWFAFQMNLMRREREKEERERELKEREKQAKKTRKVVRDESS